MRTARFVQVEDLAAGPAKRDWSPIRLLGFGLRFTDDHIETQAAAERVNAMKRAAPALLVAHGISALGIIALLSSAGRLTLFAYLSLAALMISDIILVRTLREKRLRSRQPEINLRVVFGCYVVNALACFGLFVWQRITGAPAEIGIFAVGAAIISMLTSIRLPATGFFIPALFFVGAMVATTNIYLLIWAFAVTAALIYYSFVKVLFVYRLSERRLQAEWEAQRSNRLLAEFEDSGRGWFWETTADQKLSYVSRHLAATFRRQPQEMIGVSFPSLVSSEVLDAGDPLKSERTLGFHLSAQLPFSEVTVKANTPDDVWWSVSGRPIFDEYNRFLGFRGIVTDLTAVRRSEAEISRLARYDNLTGLPNRAMMRVTLEEAVRNAELRNQSCALFLLDLDRFKNVNDTLGHPAGDELLRQVAERMSKVIGDTGQIGRLGGDEFQAVFPKIGDERKLAAIADQLIRRISMPYTIENTKVTVGTSIGIAISPQRAACPDNMIRNADLALYAAKAAGKGTYRFFSPDMHSEAQDRQILEHDLREAIAQERLELVYQPVVRAVSEQVVGFEALIRWRHPDRGFVSPAIFIPLAEEVGLIGAIGEWVMRKACAQAAMWPESVRVAVNLSPVQFADPHLPSLVISSLNASGLKADRLELEITEGVFLEDSGDTERMFSRLKEIGVRLALDDFGTGYSSLGYLKKSPFDKIKIDQSFVRGATVPSTRNAAIIRSIVTLADSLGMETTAEGVETPEELALIRELGCSQIQGYIFGKPMSPTDAASILAKAERPLQSREPRQILFRSAQLRVAGEVLPVKVRNISPGGAMVELSRQLTVGSIVYLDLGNVDPLEAEVCWSKPDKAGLTFGNKFDLKLLGTAKSKILKRAA